MDTSGAIKCTTGKFRAIPGPENGLGCSYLRSHKQLEPVCMFVSVYGRVFFAVLDHESGCVFCS